MDLLERMAAPDLRNAMVSYRNALRSHQEVVNRLNVYPVPDGDTGTNMALTLESVVAELDALGKDGQMGAVCNAISHGSLMGARGNSGIILSQILRGIADQFRSLEAAEAPAMAAALVGASEAALAAVMRPVEGTILTVARCAGDAARQAAEEGKALVEVLDAARLAGAEALAQTPELLPVLKEAGVVDAGGAGYLLMLDAMLSVAAGTPLPEPDISEAPSTPDADLASRDGSGVVGDLRYEVMYFLEAPDEAIPAFKDVWAGIGDSIVVVGGGGVWNCHIHTGDIGSAVEAALDAGRPRQIRVTDLAEQVEEERWVREADQAAELSEAPSTELGATTAVVAVATGEGVGRIFRSLGVQQIVAGGQSMNPSTAQILEAVEAAPAGQVVVLPNNDNILPVAEQVDALTSKQVRVVPTGGIAQGFAALLEYDPQAGVDDNASSMAAAATRVVSGEVTCAIRDSECSIGPICRGDWLGLSAEGIEAISSTLDGAACGLLERLLAGTHEIVTIIEGDGSAPAATRKITEWLTDRRPDLAVEVHHGGQPLYPYLFSIE